MLTDEQFTNTQNQLVLLKTTMYVNNNKSYSYVFPYIDKYQIP